MNTILRSIMLMYLVSYTMTTYGQFVEKANMPYRNAYFDIFIIRIDSNLCSKVSFAENVDMVDEKRFFESISQKISSVFFAITASIVDSACNPLGLYVSKEMKVNNINLAKGTGNFFIKPNGIFAITKDHEFIISDAIKFDTTKNIKTAIQSGPMLLTNGVINPNFDRNSKNRHIRCAVGAYSDKGNRFLVFAKSAVPVSFFQMAQLLHEKFNCLDALNLESGANCFMHQVTIPGNYDDQRVGCRYLLITL